MRLNSLGFIPPGSIRKSFIPPGLFIRALLIDALLLGASPSRFALEACPRLALQFGLELPMAWRCWWLALLLPGAGGFRCCWSYPFVSSFRLIVFVLSSLFYFLIPIVSPSGTGRLGPMSLSTAAHALRASDVPLVSLNLMRIDSPLVCASALEKLGRAVCALQWSAEMDFAV